MGFGEVKFFMFSRILENIQFSLENGRNSPKIALNPPKIALYSPKTAALLIRSAAVWGSSSSTMTMWYTILHKMWAK